MNYLDFTVDFFEKILMVRQCDLTWNPIYNSILLMYKKLIQLGFTYRDGEIVISESEQ